MTRRGASIHVEKFRVLTQKEINSGVPAWAFEKSMGKTFLEFLKKKDMEPRPKEAKAALPWVDPGVEASEDEEEDSTVESPGKEGLKAKLLKARDEVKKLERELTGKKVSTKAAGSKDKKEKVKKKKKKKQPTPEGKEKKKRKRAKESPSSGGEKKIKKEEGLQGRRRSSKGGAYGKGEEEGHRRVLLVQR